jgi:hypothetical protein
LGLAQMGARNYRMMHLPALLFVQLEVACYTL